MGRDEFLNLLPSVGSQSHLDWVRRRDCESPRPSCVIKSPPAVHPPMPYCRYCGDPVDASDAYCYGCGAAQRMQADSEQFAGFGPEEQSRRNPSPESPTGSAHSPAQSGQWSNRTAHTAQRGGRGQHRTAHRDHSHRNHSHRGQYSTGRQNHARSVRNQSQGQWYSQENHDAPQSHPGRSQSHADHPQSHSGPPQSHAARPQSRPQRGYRYQVGPSIEDGKIRYALSLPKRSGYKPVLAGGVCLFLDFLIIPILTLAGYTYRLTAAATGGRQRQPPFNDLVNLTGKGLVFSALWALIAVVGVTASLSAEAMFTAVMTDDIGGLVGLFVGLTVFYFSPAIVTLYPATGSVTTALSPQRILDFAMTQKYFVSFLVFSITLIGVVVAVYLLLVFLVIILIVGLFTQAAIGFAALFVALLLLSVGLFLLGYAGAVYLLYAAGTYWGATYYEAVQEGVVEPPMTAQDRPRYPPQDPEASGWSAGQRPARNEQYGQ